MMLIPFLPELRHAESEADAISAFFETSDVRRISNAREAAVRRQLVDATG